MSIHESSCLPSISSPSAGERSEREAEWVFGFWMGSAHHSSEGTEQILLHKFNEASKDCTLSGIERQTDHKINFFEKEKKINQTKTSSPVA